jgi:hypothetical protein
MRSELKERGCVVSAAWSRQLSDLCLAVDDYYDDSKGKDINVNDELEQEEEDCSEDEGDEDDEDDD